MERDMEIGITDIGKGMLSLHSYHPAFIEEYGDHPGRLPGSREIKKTILYDVMLDLAKWANNEIGVGVFFYMD